MAQQKETVLNHERNMLFLSLIKTEVDRGLYSRTKSPKLNDSAVCFLKDLGYKVENTSKTVKQYPDSAYDLMGYLHPRSVKVDVTYEHSEVSWK